jgi:hypothetical protein
METGKQKLEALNWPIDQLATSEFLCLERQRSAKIRETGKKILFLPVRSRNVYENKGNMDKMPDENSGIFVLTTQLLRKMRTCDNAMTPQIACSRARAGIIRAAFDLCGRGILRGDPASGAGIFVGYSLGRVAATVVGTRGWVPSAPAAR